MKKIPFLPPGADFPHPDEAFSEPDGLLAAGLDLSPQTLVMGYANGIFPWFSGDQPILWWSPSERTFFDVDTFEVSRSLNKTIRKGSYEIRTDNDFRATVEACANTPRKGQPGTWIVPEMVEAYCTLHELGFAHSVETWMDDELVGGLYGVALGKTFFGESMFSTRTDASKIALAHLMGNLSVKGFKTVDCQMHTPHLESLGALPIPRHALRERIHAGLSQGFVQEKWDFDKSLLISELSNRAAENRGNNAPRKMCP